MIKFKITVKPDPKTLIKQLEKDIENHVKKEVSKKLTAKQHITTSGSRDQFFKSGSREFFKKSSTFGIRRP